MGAFDLSLKRELESKEDWILNLNIERKIKMFLKSNLCLVLLFLLGQEAYSQNAPIPTRSPDPEPQERLLCYECDPIDLSTSHNSHMNKLECLTDDDDYGELNVCNAFDGACAKGTIDVNGDEYTVRRCHPHGKEKVGTCEEVTHLDMTVKFCFCGTDECNSSTQLCQISYSTFLITLSIFMFLGQTLYLTVYLSYLEKALCLI